MKRSQLEHSTGSEERNDPPPPLPPAADMILLHFVSFFDLRENPERQRIVSSPRTPQTTGK